MSRTGRATGHVLTRLALGEYRLFESFVNSCIYILMANDAVGIVHSPGDSRYSDGLFREAVVMYSLSLGRPLLSFTNHPNSRHGIPFPRESDDFEYPLWMHRLGDIADRMFGDQVIDKDSQTSSGKFDLKLMMRNFRPEDITVKGRRR